MEHTVDEIKEIIDEKETKTYRTWLKNKIQIKVRSFFQDKFLNLLYYIPVLGSPN